MLRTSSPQRPAIALLSALLSFTLLCCVASPLQAAAQSDKDKPSDKSAKSDKSGSEKSDSDKSATERSTRPPLPADAHTQQTIEFEGKTIHYTVTVGKLPVYDSEGKTSGEVVYTAYTVDNGASSGTRPVTFALNGGPGASSVYLNFGAIGPKTLHVGNDGDSPSDPATLYDNPGTWLDFTDLVFIDPIGTGFSRSLVSKEETKKQFYSPTPDIEYLSRVIYDWLVNNDRLTSRKYLVGESYGGFRGPRITHFLQSQLGVAMNGVVLVSPYLNPAIDENAEMSPIPWMVTLPPIAAAHLEREHKLTPAAMADVIAYTRGEYATDLLKGRSDPEATPRLIKKVTDLTGLDPEFVKYSGGRLETGAYLREAHREEGKLSSIYDSNVTSFDPFPFSPDQRANDPILASIVAPTTTAMVDFVTRVVGWKVDARYNALSDEVNREWDRGDDLRTGSVSQLREAVAADPKLRILIVHGWNDLSCPFMGSILTVDEMPIMGDPARVSVREYPGGHMFYTRPSSRTDLHADVKAMFSQH
ncbi:S10 family peptidase [Acidicapsa ligni]|uniref:S10 family peptidase n=1 Tax=Acidicapsa ligni TaxID=542300 RepID=UPI0021DF48CA|nr:peptidase S10 [Acidicapsa ligni]